MASGSSHGTSTVTCAFAVFVVVASSLFALPGNALPEGTAFDPTVPLTHCATLGIQNGFLLEWQLSQIPKNHLEMRFTANILREKFTAFGFTHQDKTQIVTGYPEENLACARSLFDTDSPFDVNGNVYPNHPELPAKIVTANDTHAAHYVMRNLSISALHMLENGHQVDTNVTILWSYMQASLFRGSCYMSNLKPYTEYATFDIPLTGSSYLKNGDGSCNKYTGPITSHRMNGVIDPTTDMLDREANQNKRVAALLIGGEMLLDSGRAPPLYDTVLGRVLGGENGNGVCQNSLSTVNARWSGFSDPVGGIKKYLVSLGTTDLPSVYADRYDAGTNEAATLSVGTLKANSSFIVTITAVNFADLQTSIVSNPVKVMNGGAPLHGWLYDGAVGSPDIDYQKSSTTVDAHWGGWRREEFSLINHDTLAVTDQGISYAIGEKDVSLTDVVDWTVLSATFVTELSISSLSLVHGKTYTISIRSVSCSTLYTVQTSNGVTVDQAPPIPGVIRYGNNTLHHQATTKQGATLRATWTGFFDQHSGIASYAWAMGLGTPAPDVVGNTGNEMPWTNVGAVTSAVGPRIHTFGALTEGTNFYIYVKAIDNVGNFVVVTSNATQVVGN